LIAKSTYPTKIKTTTIDKKKNKINQTELKK
jgi:hypothetical protein